MTVASMVDTMAASSAGHLVAPTVDRSVGMSAATLADCSVDRTAVSMAAWKVGLSGLVDLMAASKVDTMAEL